MIDNSPSAVWTEVVAAVDFLSQSERLGMTVWDALDEAIRLWAEEWFGVGATRTAARTEEDPLRASVEVLLRSVASGALPGGQPLDQVLTAALQLWLAEVRERHNQGQPYTFAASNGWMRLWLRPAPDGPSAGSTEAR